MCLNDYTYYAREEVNRLKNAESIVVYGIGNVATYVEYCLTNNPYNLIIDAFMVSENQNIKCDTFRNRPIISPQMGQEKYKDALIIIAVIEKYVTEIEDTLELFGYKDRMVMSFESDLWSEIRGNKFFYDMKVKGENCIPLEGELELINSHDGRLKGDFSIYMATCHLDKQLDEKKDFFEKPIQVGAALTDISIAQIKDNTGENISVRNKEYCELTGLYWAWKNDKESDYLGLSHYRRHFCINEVDAKKILKSDIDVILTLPILNYPSVKEMYRNDHIIHDWEIMMEAIKKLYPEYFDASVQIEKGLYYAAYNMFIARKDIFNDYCTWLFSILKYCEDNCEEHESGYQGRYLGFLSERLLSIYFWKHRKDYKIVFAKKKFIQ